MDNNLATSQSVSPVLDEKVFKVKKPNIIYSEPTVQETDEEVVYTREEPTLVQEIRLPEEVKEEFVEPNNMSSQLDSIVNDIQHDTTNLEETLPERPLMEQPVMSSPVVVPQASIVYESPTKPAISEEQQRLLSLTQELKLDLSEADKLTEEFLTPDEASSLVIEKKNVDSVSMNANILNKYKGLYGPDEQGLFNLTFNDGNSYITVIDYLESENVLDAIPFDSEVEFDDGTKIKGVDFIRSILIPYLQKNGYHTIVDTEEILGVNKVTKEEKKKSILKGLFGRH